MAPVDLLVKDCREKAYYAFGTSKIFERRRRRLESGRNWITYLGIVVPLLVGSLGLSFGKEWAPVLAVPAGIAITIQLVLSLWSVVYKWDDKYSYSIRAMQEQTKLFNAWDGLAKQPPADLGQRIKDLAAEDQRQETNDMAQNISEKEKRFGMRKTLYQYGLACQTCKQNGRT